MCIDYADYGCVGKSKAMMIKNKIQVMIKSKSKDMLKD
jgi:hypothetical protein